VCHAIACVSAPPAPAARATPAPPAQPFEQKMAWILRLEDQRVLRDVSSATAAASATGGNTAVTPPTADLGRLLADPEARVRRRAALAVGRVGLREGAPLLIALLNDSDPEVRQIAAFALGLIGDRIARDPLVTALEDQSPLVQGSAAEALGLLGDPAAAAPVGAMVSRLMGTLAELPADVDESRRDTPSAAFRLGLEALVRLKAYDALAAAVLDPSGQPRVSWWPAAFALGRLEDRRALPALLTLAKNNNPYVKAFAAKGLGALHDRSAVPVLLPLLTGTDAGAQVEAIRALGRIGDPAAAEPLLRIVQTSASKLETRLEAVTALGGIQAPGVIETLADMLADRNPAIRAAALRSSAALDSDGFVAILSGLDPDPDWHVRTTMAAILSTLPTRTGLPRLNAMLGDSDQRVIAAVLNALVKIGAPNAGALLLDHLSADDPVVRAAAAAGLGELRAPAGAQALPAAYQYGLRDSTYIARAAVVEAFAKYGITSARSLLDAALADKDWAVRVKAAALLKQADPAVDTEAGVTADCAAGLHAGVHRDRAGYDRDRAGCPGRAVDRREFHLARAQGILQRADVPSRGLELRRAGRRPEGRRRRRPRVHDSRRDQREALRAGHRRHGARLGRYGRQPVLHHALAGAAPGREVHRLRPCHLWDGSRRSASGRRRHSPHQSVGRAGVVGGKVKRGRRPPPFLTGEVSLPFLAGLLLPALGFLRHCLLSPPSFGFHARHRQSLPPGTLTR
jgi:HEAT repeat protein